MKLKKTVDCHVHCNYSNDSTATPECAVEYACSIGLGGITLTDHMDLDYPNKAYTFMFDIPKRESHLKQIREAYRNKINVYIGIELGLQPQVLEQSKELIRNNNFDCVICSIHSVDKYCLCSQKGFFEGKSQHEAFNRYLKEIYWSVTNFDDFDIVGHIGYIRRYGNYDNNQMPYHEYSDIIDAILRTVINKGKAIEANSSGTAYKLDGPIPSSDILKRYKELGGEYITLGSDSHGGNDVAREFQPTRALLQSLGFKYITHFKARKAILSSY